MQSAASPFQERGEKIAEKYCKNNQAKWSRFRLGSLREAWRGHVRQRPAGGLKAMQKVFWPSGPASATTQMRATRARSQTCKQTSGLPASTIPVRKSPVCRARTFESLDAKVLAASARTWKLHQETQELGGGGPAPNDTTLLKNQLRQAVRSMGMETTRPAGRNPVLGPKEDPEKAINAKLV